jgi:hypothetical protein
MTQSVREDIQKYRESGKVWESRLGIMAREYGVCDSYRTYQKDKENASLLVGIVSPDVGLFRDSWGVEPFQYHEVKHRRPWPSPTEWGTEQYRFDHLLKIRNKTSMPVYISNHDYKLAGGKEAPNDLRHWFSADVLRLSEMPHRNFRCRSIVNGAWEEDVLAIAWASDIFRPLAEIWGLCP